MDASVWWVIAAAGLAVAEVFTLDLVFAMAAAGALSAAGVAFADGNTAVQLTVGIAVALAGLVVLRPVALRHLRSTPQLRTGTAALVGAQALVLSDVGPHDGRVKLNGEIWSARSYDGSSVYGIGQGVAVLQIDGATALVG